MPWRDSSKLIKDPDKPVEKMTQLERLGWIGKVVQLIEFLAEKTWAGLRLMLVGMVVLGVLAGVMLWQSQARNHALDQAKAASERAQAASERAILASNKAKQASDDARAAAIKARNDLAAAIKAGTESSAATASAITAIHRLDCVITHNPDSCKLVGMQP